MPELSKTLYGDGSTSVVFNEKTVTFAQYGGSVTISHAAMREIMLSWERKEMRETD